jgi:hypothetical protein
VTEEEVKAPLFRKLLMDLAIEADKGNVGMLQRKLEMLKEALKGESESMEQEITTKIVTGGKVSGGPTEEPNIRPT